MTKSCPVCEGDALPAYVATDENRRVSAVEFHYLRCTECGTIFLTNVPADLDRYYGADYYEFPTRERLDRLASKSRSKIDIVKRFASGNRLLEVGPAFGVFVRQAQIAGYEVSAIEMDSACCAYLESTLGIDAVNANSPEQVLPSLPPKDAIVAWHVIEHLPEPRRFIEAAAQNLPPAGILVLATPNPSATQWKIMRSSWPHLDAPRHLALLPSETLIRIAAACGLELLFLTSTDPEGKSWDRFGWQRLLMNRFESKWMQKAMFVAGYVLSFLLAPLDRRQMKGSAYTLVLRKAA